MVSSFFFESLDQDLEQLKENYSRQDFSGAGLLFKGQGPQIGSPSPGLYHYNLSYLSFREGDFSQSLFHLYSAQKYGVNAPFLVALEKEIQERAGFTPLVKGEKLFHTAIAHPTLMAYGLGSLFLLLILLLVKLKFVQQLKFLLPLCLTVTLLSFTIENKLLSLKIGIVKKEAPIHSGPKLKFDSTFENLPEGLCLIVTRSFPQWIQFFHLRGQSGWTKRDNILLVNP